MVTAGARIKFTYEDYRNAPEDKRYELIDGELYMVPSPKEAHQGVSMNFAILLGALVRRLRIGYLYAAPFDVVLSDTDVVQPDLVFVSRERAHIITSDNIRGVPDLVIEILSPSTAERDKTFKRALYARYGVREFWLVNTDTHTIEVLVLTEDGFETYAVFAKGQTLTSPTFTDFALSIDEVF